MKKGKLISSIIVLCLVVGMIIMATVFTLLPQKGITNQITFIPDNLISFSVECEATWATGENSRIFIETKEDGSLTEDQWNAPSINFNNILPASRTVVMSFKFKNTSNAGNNELKITFDGIASDSKNPSYMANERFYAEVQQDNGEKRKLVYAPHEEFDDGFVLASGEERVFKIYYTIVSEKETFSEEQNIKINIEINN